MELDEVTDRLQNLVMENYETFIDTSKQISNLLEQDLIEISNSLSDMKKCIKTMQQHHLQHVSQDLDNEEGDPLNGGGSSSTFSSQSTVSSLIKVLSELFVELDVAVQTRKFANAVVSVEKSINSSSYWNHSPVY